MTVHRSIATLVLAAAIAAPGVVRAEPVLLAEESNGSLELARESRLRIRGVRGDVYLKLGAAGQLRFMSHAPGREDDELAVSLWGTGGALEIRAPEGAEQTPRVLWVAVPANLSVEVELEDSNLTAVDLQDDLEVEGSRLELTAKRLEGRLDVDLEGGSIRALKCGGDVTISGSGFEAELLSLDGGLDLSAEGSRIRLLQANGPVEADLDESVLAVDEAGGDFRLDATGGRVQISRLGVGGEITLSRSPLVLRQSKGAIRIVTDGAVQLEENEGTIGVEGYGGPVTGSGNNGALEIGVSDAEVSFQTIGGRVGIRGDHLRVNLEAALGELAMTLTSSEVNVEGATGPVTIENDFGDVLLANTSGAVKVTNRDGAVHVTGASGPVEIEADGREVQVSLASFSREKDSRITNTSGDVTVEFPASGGCRVEVEARRGRIEGEHPGLRVSDDGSFASGVINRVSRPTMQIRSGGNVYLSWPESEQD